MEKSTLIKVMNRSDGAVFYSVQDLGIHRHYEVGEIKEVTFEELQKLSYSSGGLTLLKDYLKINNREAIEELLGEVEPEYFYDKEDVQKLLLSGSLDQLKDCLDFAEEGVIDLVKDLAVKLEINDVSKRQTIFEKTGFNVNRAIEINHETHSEQEETSIAKRRSAPITKDGEKTRRADPPKYTVVSKS